MAEAEPLPSQGPLPGSDSESDPPDAAYLLKRIGLRLALHGALGALVMFVFVCVAMQVLARARGAPFWPAAIEFCLGGVFAGGVSVLAFVVEVRALRAGRGLGPGRALGWAGLGGLLVFLGLIVAALQAAYAMGNLEGRTEAFLRRMVETLTRDANYLLFLAVLSAPFVPLTWARIRGLGWKGEVLATLLGTLLLASIAVLLMDTSRRVEVELAGQTLRPGVQLLIEGVGLVVALLLPLAFWIGDRLERRLLPPKAA